MLLKTPNQLSILHEISFFQFWLCKLSSRYTALSTLGHYLGTSLTHPMLITPLFSFNSKVTIMSQNKQSHNQVGSLRLVDHLVGFELRTFQFCHNALTHQATLPQFFGCNTFPGNFFKWHNYEICTNKNIGVYFLKQPDYGKSMQSSHFFYQKQAFQKL